MKMRSKRVSRRTKIEKNESTLDSAYTGTCAWVSGYEIKNLGRLVIKGTFMLF